MANEKFQPMGSGPALYGLSRSNRSGRHLWGKNEFNSTFPVALCCWMRDKQLPLRSVIAVGNGRTDCREATFDEVFGGTEPRKYLFEHEYSKYAQVVRGKKRPKCDVVVIGSDPGAEHHRGLEVKLTALPDASTAKLARERWGPEIVFRHATIYSASLSIFTSAADRQSSLLRSIRSPCSAINKWDSEVEVLRHFSHIKDGLRAIVDEFHASQAFCVLQPVWAWDKQFGLAPQAFDVFAWTDFAFLQVLLDACEGQDSQEISRPGRAAIMVARILYDLCTRQEVNLDHIKSTMVYRKQSDKALSLPGRASMKYLHAANLMNLRVHRSSLPEIVPADGVKALSPEKRLDATIVSNCADLYPNEAPR